MLVEYIVNLNHGVVHQMVDGKTRESCNIDQISPDKRLILTWQEFEQSKWRRCKRCIYNEARVSQTN